MLLAGCGGGGEVSLAALAQRQQSFAGKRVETHGTVLEQRDPGGRTYFVLADAADDLVGLQPSAKARPYLGEHVDVGGRFDVRPGFGRVLSIESIRRR